MDRAPAHPPASMQRLTALSVALVLAVFGFWLYVTWSSMHRAGELSFAVDFRVFWAAARLALQGEAVAAFDQSRLVEIHGLDTGWLPWLHPPHFLALIAPLGALSFYGAWIGFALISLSAMALAARSFNAGRLAVWPAIALAPAILPVLILGQISLIWGAGLLAALTALRDGRQGMAGVLLGLLTVKPQLGLLIAVALLASRQWRAIVVATVTMLLLLAASTQLFGLDYWSAMSALSSEHFSVMRERIAEAPLMVSPYAALAGMGLPEPMAMSAQWAICALLAALTYYIWSRPGLGFELRAGVLLTAIPLSIPYFWYHDTALFAPALLCLLLSRALMPAGPLRYLGRLTAVLLYLGAAPITLMQLFSDGAELELRLYIVPLALIAFALALRAAIKAMPQGVTS